MSTDYYMTCHACKKALWVAQDGLSGFTFYSGEPETMRKLRDFLAEHKEQEHPLELASEHRMHELLDDQGYVDVDDTPAGVAASRPEGVGTQPSGTEEGVGKQ